MAGKKGIGDAIGQKMIEYPELDRKILSMKKSLDQINQMLKNDKKKK